MATHLGQPQNPFNIMPQWMGCHGIERFERLSTRAVLQAEFRLTYHRGLKLSVKHPSLGLRLTNAATWKKKAEFARILKKITRKPDRSFQSKKYIIKSAGPSLIGHHSRLEVHLRKEVYIL
jgi:hypothetical protein